eukprot:1433230-Prymnesium_polylepis.1
MISKPKKTPGPPEQKPERTAAGLGIISRPPMNPLGHATRGLLFFLNNPKPHKEPGRGTRAGIRDETQTGEDRASKPRRETHPLGLLAGPAARADKRNADGVGFESCPGPRSAATLAQAAGQAEPQDGEKVGQIVPERVPHEKGLHVARELEVPRGGKREEQARDHRGRDRGVARPSRRPRQGEAYGVECERRRERAVGPAQPRPERQPQAAPAAKRIQRIMRERNAPLQDEQQRQHRTGAQWRGLVGGRQVRQPPIVEAAASAVGEAREFVRGDEQRLKGLKDLEPAGALLNARQRPWQLEQPAKSSKPRDDRDT